MARAQRLGMHFIDAPVSGGQAGAVNGVLTVMCGGEQAVFDRIKPVAQVFGRGRDPGRRGRRRTTGENGQPDLHRGPGAGLSEGIAFGQSAGLDMKLVLDVISKGAAQSWQMENRGSTMVDDKFDFGFAVNWMRKDLGLVLEEARANGACVPVTALVDQFYGRRRRWAAGAGIRPAWSSACTRLLPNRRMAAGH